MIDIPDFSDRLRLVRDALARPADETLDHAVSGPYLEKWLVEKDGQGNARYVHRFLRSDQDDETHDHPWDNVTICVKGGYWNVTPAGRFWIGPGDIVHRRAQDFHRVELEPGADLPVTIFDHGPKINEWGFLLEDGTKIPWAKFCEKSAMYRR